MWDFPRYKSGEWAFSFSRGVSATMGARAGAGAGIGAGTGARTGAGAGTGALASRTALRILYKSSSEYLRTLGESGALAMEGFGFEGPACWSDNSSPDSGSGDKSGGATEGVTEGYSRRGRPRPWTEVILELIPSKTLFQTGWLTHWVWRN